MDKEDNVSAGQVITDEVRRLIAQVYVESPRMPAKRIRDEVNLRYRNKYKNISENWPGLSAVQKQLHEIRLKHIPNPKDVPWSLYTLAEYDIPADALKAVLDVYAITMTWDSEPLLTVREAQWVARLYRVITNVEELAIIARQCADNEILNEITGNSSPGLVDADFDIRARTGKPGVSYKYEGHGKYRLVLHNREIADRIVVTPLPKRLIDSDMNHQNST
jgi:hypothetical protein